MGGGELATGGVGMGGGELATGGSGTATGGSSNLGTDTVGCEVVPPGKQLPSVGPFQGQHPGPCTSSDSYGTVRTYVYDNNGVVISSYEAEGETTYTHDANGWLSNMTTPHGDSMYDNSTPSIIVETQGSYRGEYHLDERHYIQRALVDMDDDGTIDFETRQAAVARSRWRAPVLH